MKHRTRPTERGYRYSSMRQAPSRTIALRGPHLELLAKVITVSTFFLEPLRIGLIGPIGLILENSNLATIRHTTGRGVFPLPPRAGEFSPCHHGQGSFPPATTGRGVFPLPPRAGEFSLPPRAGEFSPCHHGQGSFPPATTGRGVSPCHHGQGSFPPATTGRGVFPLPPRAGEFSPCHHGQGSFPPATTA